MMTLKINKWDSFRIALIAVAIGGVAVVLGHEFLSSDSQKQQALNQVSFPETVPLSNWQLVKATPIAAKSQEYPDPGKRYEYRNLANEKLDVETIYQLYTDGNASRLLMVYEGIPPATLIPQAKYKKEIGHYYTFDYQDKAYISACMPPKGETVVTQQQYIKNRSRYGWSIPRAFSWLIGQQDLYDSRCLWTVLSMPVTEQAPQTLENTWFEWHRWWQQNPFPAQSPP